MQITPQHRFIWRLFARVNPVYAPRRKQATAHRWAMAAQKISNFMQLSSVHLGFQSKLIEWAAITVLDASPRLSLPPDYSDLEYGGVEAAALRSLAEMIITTGHVSTEFSELQWLAWERLYPATARLSEYASTWRRGSFDDRATAAIAEWELLLDDAIADSIALESQQVGV